MKTTILLILACALSLNTVFAQDNIRNVAPEATAAEAAGSFRDIPILQEAFINSAPADRKDGILVGELGVNAGNKEMILNLAQEIAGNQYGVFDSFLIAHKGKLLFESYFTRGRINLPHPQSSVTKSYTGLALGRAIQLGYLTMGDLNKPLASLLKDLDPSKFAKGVEKVTLYQALTMTTGIQVNPENKKKIRNDPKLNGQKLVQALLEHSAPITTEAQMFKYSDGPELVMQVIGAVVPGTAQDFIKNEFLDKMGITNYDWPTIVSGLPRSGGRVSITSRDMVKLGTLAMNKGRWQGEQLIPEAFMTQAISRINYSADDVKVFGGGKDTSNQGYGYFWWGTDLKNGSKSYFSASAQGGGGQFIILIEELELIIVATGQERHPTTLQITAERVLPAFTK